MTRNRHLTRPTHLESEVYAGSDAILVKTRPKSQGRWFLMVWLTGWTVGCVALLGVVIAEPQLMTFLFAVPFWAAWLAVASMLTWSWFGKETLLLQADRAVFMRKAIVTLSTREVPITEIQSIRTARSTVQENDEHLYGIEVDTVGKPIRFGFRLSGHEREWIIHELQQFLKTHGVSTRDSGAETAVGDDRTEDGVPITRLSSTVPGQRLQLEDTLPEPPSDSSWTLTERVEGPEFSRRGRLSLSSTLTLLFINCFWNGIVSVFVCLLWGFVPVEEQPQGVEWWFLFVFLIPFEVIGLVMFIGLVLTVIEPLRKTVWRIQYSELLSENRWPLFSFKGRWRCDEIAEIQLHRHSSEAAVAQSMTQKPSQGVSEFDESDDSGYQLVFIGRDGNEIAKLKNATEGEARWIAHVFMTHERSWSA